MPSPAHDDYEDILKELTALRLSNERYALAVTAAKVGVGDWDIPTNAFTIDPGLMHLLGYNRKVPFKGVADYAEMVHPDDRERLLEAFEYVVDAKRDAFEVEYRILPLTGSTRWLLARGWVTRDEQGEAVRVLSAHMDITDRIRTETALRASEMRYLTILENTVDGVSVYEMPEDQGEPRIIDCNEGYASMAGRDRKDILVRRKGHLGGFPGDAELDAVKKAHKTGLLVNGTSTWPLPDGGEQFVEYQAAPVDIEERSYVYCLDRNVTQRVLAEKALRVEEENMRALFDATSRSSIMLTDAGGKVLAINKTGTELLKRAAEKILGQRIHDLLPPELAQKRQAHHRKAAKSGEPLKFQDEWNNLVFQHTIYPILDPESNVARLALFSEDITEQVRLEKQLLQMQKMEAIGAMAGGIAHDFNNILGVIIKNAEMVTAGLPEDRKLHKKMDRILSASLQARDLVKQILTFSRADEHRKKPVPVRPLVSESLKLLRASIPSTIDIRRRLAENAGTVLADPTQLQQIVMNLIVNAEQAMRASGGVLNVKLENVDLGKRDIARLYPELTPGPFVRLTVKDSGEGMTPGVLERIFEPFYTTKGKGIGTGLGLTMVHGIVQKHEGAIRAHSEPGEGSIFEVLLPRIEDWSVDAPEAEPKQVKGKGHILLVDDEKDYRQTVRETLELLGYTVEDVADGSRALRLFKKTPLAFNLILTDQTMPVMTGMDLLRQAAAIRSDIPIILCTGYSETLDMPVIQGLGALLLPKPFTRDELASAVRSVLDRRLQGDRNG
jgi:PAS domain S-box-containing protein